MGMTGTTAALTMHRFGIALFIGFLGLSHANASRLTDAQAKQAIIQQSLASYPGTCPCPYNIDRRGHSCGRRSAYSGPGGYSPICYAEQVTTAMIANYRRAH
jgi:hypothetical protein